MIELNLKADTKEQELIKAYLQENVSEVLAGKINNGVKIVKENKTLISKKDLNGFMKYAQDEARKLAEKGTNYACVEDKTVYGWAIHYFEEDTIEGTLYNEDGTKYKPVAKKIENKPAPKVEVKKPEKQQATLFDFFDKLTETKEENEEPDELFEEEKEPPIETITNEEKPLLQSEIQTFDKDYVKMLFSLLDGKIEIK